jgi:hypothetical protein
MIDYPEEQRSRPFAFDLQTIEGRHIYAGAAQGGIS